MNVGRVKRSGPSGACDSLLRQPCFRCLVQRKWAYKTDNPSGGRPIEIVFMTAEPAKKQFVVVLRAPSSIVFSKNEKFRIENIKTPYGSSSVTYASRWVSTPGSMQLPGQLWIEVIGDGPNIRSVVPVFANIGSKWLSVISLASNAAIEHPTVELAFEKNAADNEREFFQSFVRPEGYQLSEGRVASIRTISELLEKFLKSDDGDRLLRAANQYRLALDHWRAGTETLALAHCWMAVEALTKVQLRLLHKQHGTRLDEELAEILFIPLKELDATIRKRHLLGGDDECYKKAKKASDGFEHGFLEFDEINAHAVEVIERLAKYVRAAVLRMSDLSRDVEELLLAEPYGSPLGTWPLVKFVTGKLVGSSSDIATKGQAYPFIRWRSTVESCSFDDNGRFSVRVKDSITPEVGGGISFRLSSIQVWRGGSAIDVDASVSEPKKGDVEIVLAEGQDDLGSKERIVSVDDLYTKNWASKISALLINMNAIKHMALFWICQLDERPPYQVPEKPFSMHVKMIQLFLLNSSVSTAFLKESKACWDEALALDEVSEAVIRGAPAPQGLICYTNRTSKGAPVISDPKKIDELNESAIRLATRLAELLETLQADDSRVVKFSLPILLMRLLRR